MAPYVSVVATFGKALTSTTTKDTVDPPPFDLTPPMSRRSFLGAAAGTGALLALGACGSTNTNPASSGPMKAAMITTCVYAKNHASSPLYWQRFTPKGITAK